MTHGCSPFAVTRRNLTALDIITAHTLMPGRGDVALLLEEAMRGDGWTGGRMEEKRKVLEERLKAKGKRKNVRESVAKALQVDQKWWGADDSDDSADSDLEEEEDVQESVFVSISLWAQPERSSPLHRHLLLTLHPCLSFRRKHCPRFSSLLSLIFNHHFAMHNQQIHYICLRGLLVSLVTTHGSRTLSLVLQTPSRTHSL